MKKLSLLLCLIWAAPVWAAEATAVEAPATGETTATVQPAAPTPTGTVERAVFTSSVQDREPVDKLSTLTNDQTQIYFFTELRDMAGQTVIHRWEHKGKTMSEVSFNVGAARWRVYSSKKLDPSWLGEWKVSVLDSNGGTLNASTFSYVEAPAATPAPAETSTQPAAPSN